MPEAKQEISPREQGNCASCIVTYSSPHFRIMRILHNDPTNRCLTGPLYRYLSCSAALDQPGLIPETRQPETSDSNYAWSQEIGGFLVTTWGTVTFGTKGPPRASYSKTKKHQFSSDIFGAV
ncbi:hypothetical protein NXS19_009335 [Fusarium pseudograminearum]|nr:hypothetical protein NXS19_009335 [Fusarium pseudograminearum]